MSVAWRMARSTRAAPSPQPPKDDACLHYSITTIFLDVKLPSFPSLNYFEVEFDV
jgi:hypothetical protein